MTSPPFSPPLRSTDLFFRYIPQPCTCFLSSLFSRTFLSILFKVGPPCLPARCAKALLTRTLPLPCSCPFSSCNFFFSTSALAGVSVGCCKCRLGRQYDFWPRSEGRNPVVFFPELHFLLSRTLPLLVPISSLDLLLPTMLRPARRFFSSSRLMSSKTVNSAQVPLQSADQVASTRNAAAGPSARRTPLSIDSIRSVQRDLYPLPPSFPYLLTQPSPDRRPSVLEVEYAVRGAVPQKAGALAAQLANGDKLPFDKIVYANIGNPQQKGLNQKPITWWRQVRPFSSSCCLLGLCLFFFLIFAPFEAALGEECALTRPLRPSTRRYPSERARSPR